MRKQGIKMKIKTEEMKKIEEQARTLRSELEQLKRDVSDVRKQGYYTKSVEPLLFHIWPKIRMYGATGSQQDMNEVKELFRQVRGEIEKIKKGGDNPYMK